MVGAQMLLLLLAVGWASAAVQNVTFQPSRQVPEAHKYLRHLAKNVTFRADIGELISLIQEDWVREYATVLSGEASTSSQTTRWSNSIGLSTGINMAVQYVEQKMSLEFGARVEVDYWDSARGPNVLSVFPGVGPNANSLVIMGAHLDDIPSSGRAPGANDDGSGSAALLAMAQAIAEYDAKFDYTLVLEHYTGEEQGLLGSRALARKRAARGDSVLAMIQQDMTALQRAGDPLGVAFVTGNAVNEDTSAIVKSVFKRYAESLPGLTIYDSVLSGSQCCSDHQSYQENGFPSVGLIEPRGYTGDPQYHQSGDLVNRADYSVAQATLVAKGALAAAATLAGLMSVGPHDTPASTA